MLYKQHIHKRKVFWTKLLNKINLHVFFCLLLLICMSCNQNNATDELIESVDPLLCSEGSLDKNSDSGGYTWSGITVGITSMQEVISKLGEPIRIKQTNIEENSVMVCELIFDKSTFWVSGDTVVGIEFASFGKRSPEEDLPQNIEDLARQYGKPDIVGWSSRYGPNYRLAIWPEKGVAAEILVSDQISKVVSVLYFSPLPTSEFTISTFSFRVKFSRPEIGDVVDTSPQDPFNWDP